MKFLVAFSRIIVGLLFIISGLIKANDPLGFSYKLNDYWDVFGMSFMEPASLYIAVFICVIEVALGITTLFGIRMVQTSWALLLLILFFTFLTFYSAYFNKVTDCGCFGDALKGTFGRSLTPWESFTKDIILLFFILIIFIYRKKIKPLFSSAAVNNIILVVAIAGSLGFAIYCIMHLPVKDFRPYKKGSDIPSLMKLPEGAQPDVYEIKLVYKNTKTGEVKEFDQKNYPWQDTTWVWQETKNTLIKKGDEAPIHDFKIQDIEGNDYTEDILNDPQPVFLLISYNITKTNKKAHERFNKFAESAFANGISVIGLTASPSGKVDEFRHEVQSMVDYYYMDEITLKTIIRSNPGLVLLKQGTVLAKWHHNDFPTFEEAREQYLTK